MVITEGGRDANGVYQLFYSEISRQEFPTYMIARSAICYTQSFTHWLIVVVLGLSSHFCCCFLYTLLLHKVNTQHSLVSNIFEKWLQDFVLLGNPLN